MDTIFKNMDEEKRDRIINSALEEFSKNGFDKASTNVIVKNAKISKGLLFHYFSTKRELYEKLKEFTIQSVANVVADNIDWNVTDFFERVKQIMIIKGEVIYQYPFIYDFFALVRQTEPIDELKKYSEKLTYNLTEKVYSHNIDFSRFRDDIDPETAMTIIKWTIEKLGEDFAKRRISRGTATIYKGLEKEVVEYIDTLKKGFYKS